MIIDKSNCKMFTVTQITVIHVDHYMKVMIIF